MRFLQLFQTTTYAFRPKISFPTLRFSCVTYAARILAYWITRVSVLDDMNDQFPLINNISLSFGMLISIKKNYELIN